MRDRPRGSQLIPLVTGAGLFALVTRAILSLPGESAGLSVRVTEAAADNGISNVVTAVLLDFRGYDTLLEIAVLMLVTVAVFSLRETTMSPTPLSERPGPVLGALTRTVIPVMLLVAGHFVWIGSSRPGGAFQAGAVIGAAGILLALSGYSRPKWVGPRAISWVLSIGLLVFVGVAVYPVLLGEELLQYPAESRKALILVIEALLTLSIGASLVSLFIASASPRVQGDRE
ncbi:MAG: hydrogen gas-evolving membrane-bound hydrogenase subunit E [Coriobacteriia bacterium]